VGPLSEYARLLGGELRGQDILCPGPGHSDRDRSLSVKFDPAAPGGFLIHSFAGDNISTCRDHVSLRLRIGPLSTVGDRVAAKPKRAAATPASRTAAALRIWTACADPTGTVVQRYLESRCLLLYDGIAAALRYHPGLLLDGERHPAMVALLRDVATKEPCGIHQTWLDKRDASKLARRMLGRAKAAAVRLDCNPSFTGVLTVGEGIETSLAARQLGLGPVWALGSAGGISAFPILNDVEVLNVLGECDDNGANERAVKVAATRWLAAGKQVFVYMPPEGDVNDLLTAIPP
jgi:putative DNA primase/helicase